MPGAKNRENRREDRFKLAREIFVVSPAAVGLIIDISDNGFAANFFPEKGFEPENEWMTDIFEFGGILIKDIAIRLKWLETGNRNSSLGAMYIQRAGVQFCDLAVLQKAQLGFVFKANKMASQKVRATVSPLVAKPVMDLDSG